MPGVSGKIDPAHIGGTGAARSYVLTWDGGRARWSVPSVVIPVLHGVPAVMVEGLIWFNLDATC